MMLLVDCVGHYGNSDLAVLFNLRIVSKSPAELSTSIGAYGIVLSR